MRQDLSCCEHARQQNTTHPSTTDNLLHSQDSNYPIGSGAMSEAGKGAGEGFTVNVPLPPGSGSGAYRGAFERIVLPALDAFAPQLIFASAGFDASAMDPLASMMVSAAL